MSETISNSKAAGGEEKLPSIVDRMKGDVDGQGAQMTFMEHLLELRRRLWTSSLVIVICMVLSMLFYEQLVAAVRWPVERVNQRFAAEHEKEMREYERKLQGDPGAVKPMPLEIKLISTDPMETILMIMWLSIGAGLVFSSPVLLYQLWAFVAPGLRAKEKRAVKPVLYGGIFFFLGGCALAYFLLFPFSIHLFSVVNARVKFESMWTVNYYTSLLFNMMAISGLVCEAPLVVAGLAKLGTVKPGHLTQYWRYCVFGSFVLGAFFSPGADIMSMLLFSALLLSLYIVSIIMAYVFYPKGLAAGQGRT